MWVVPDFTNEVMADIYNKAIFDTEKDVHRGDAGRISFIHYDVKKLGKEGFETNQEPPHTCIKFIDKVFTRKQTIRVSLQHPLKCKSVVWYHWVLYCQMLQCS